MNRKHLLQYLFLCLFALFTLPARANLPSDELQLQSMQVNACRALGSLLLLRGEGFQEVHANQLKADLAALDAAVKGYAKADDGLRKAYQALQGQVRAGTTYGPREEDLPWTYLADLSRALRDFLGQVERFVPPAGANELPLWQLPVRVEYLTAQYLARAYLGVLEIAREAPQTYIGQDEKTLLPLIGNSLSRLPPGTASSKLQMRWNYLSTALGDMNSKSNALVSASGRPWAPIIVERHARELTDQLMRLSQAQ
ncbi:hypothetical protein SAMN05216189_100967 [Pseudomonas delhiensis]|uniref:Type IV pili methyl-accepting chemotaxis transducer N-term n=1 Tax=Pseudomonas delhiensis TaxID=366289 RepID=A0A239H0G1_9PSED|nr:hypothetical protein [Pseudomonas delhiensis]SDI81999.1 hypothetical protein SAMN05216189_100967 [Pseudomonas delhiensis]SNS74651.1 hypothetical protein SAMN06295949_106128 [Pseudomonas delhiensis]